MVRLLCILLLSLSYQAWAYPLIDNLNPRDGGFVELQQRVEENDATPVFYEYTVKKGETLLYISKKARISISALITGNRSYSVTDTIEGETIIIPSSKGVFLSLKPAGDIEFLISYRLSGTLKLQKPIFITHPRTRNANVFYFLHNQVLTKQEYYLWSNPDFRVPVLKGYISSYYGYRISPISGYKIFHKGIDIASKSATEIFASKSGVVTQDGYDQIYGYYIVINHGNGYETLYGHLLDVNVQVGDSVVAGQHFAYMGNTGKSTGPHLHFEVHVNSKHIDPLTVLSIN